MVSQISLECEVCPEPENIGNKDGESSAPASLQEHDVEHMPVPKQTRQWAAWTRQEEESFFAALRQVGKNFEKITSRVQSKNKDQVRHYYYRLVRRMNKLLGPEFCLDAKNSKDTIAAMLRWWSLLEKYSCKASKLHLKPRRFKIFIEALENQLQRDRKKNVRKRPSTGEDNSSTGQGKVSGHDNRAAKTVLGDSQNVQKVVTGKGSLPRRNVNIGTNRNNCKGDSTSTSKTEKKRKKTGLVATTAYKRWEKAAIAGVSLVADAAEHLERVNTDKETERVQETPAFLGHDDSQHVEKAVVDALPVPPQCVLNENNNNINQNATKLKLQLFPINECTRMALEMDNHNPHLELTLSTRKKISSVVEHLNRKWGKGNSSLLSQELMLFPYWAQRENLVGYQKWTKDSPLCAADVYYLIGSPPVFRLRYGWFSKAEIELATSQALSCTNQHAQSLNINIGKEQNSETDKRRGSLDMTTFLRTNTREYVGSGSNIETGGLAAMRQVENTKDMALSAGDWADSLTSLSMGDLLSESIQQNMDVNCNEFTLQSTSNFQQMPFSCDSFDAAIAAHIYKHQNKVLDSHQQLGLLSHGPSIWDAEETCDAFAFQKRSTFCDQSFRNISPQNSTTNPLESHNEIEELTEMEKLTDVDLDLDPTCEDLVNECRPVNTSDNSPKDFGGLTDIYWPDSLGPLDLGIPSRKYHSEDLILSDSLGGLSRLIANSMDAFQSCSFLGLDKKEATTGSTVEARPPASFSDFKISSEV